MRMTLLDIQKLSKEEEIKAMRILVFMKINKQNNFNEMHLLTPYINMQER